MCQIGQIRFIFCNVISTFRKLFLHCSAVFDRPKIRKKVQSQIRLKRHLTHRYCWHCIWTATKLLTEKISLSFLKFGPSLAKILALSSLLNYAALDIYFSAGATTIVEFVQPAHEKAKISAHHCLWRIFLLNCKTDLQIKSTKWCSNPVVNVEVHLLNTVTKLQKYESKYSYNLLIAYSLIANFF